MHRKEEMDGIGLFLFFGNKIIMNEEQRKRIQMELNGNNFVDEQRKVRKNSEQLGERDDVVEYHREKGMEGEKKGIIVIVVRMQVIEIIEI